MKLVNSLIVFILLLFLSNSQSFASGSCPCQDPNAVDWQLVFGWVQLAIVVLAIVWFCVSYYRKRR